MVLRGPGSYSEFQDVMSRRARTRRFWRGEMWRG